jgi:adenylosuccinate lyase
MSRIFSPAYKFGTWRRLWLALAEAQRELGLEIPDARSPRCARISTTSTSTRAADIEKAAAPRRDGARASLRRGRARREGVIHLGATSAYVTDNTELMQHRDALRLVRQRLLATIAALAAFAEQHARCRRSATRTSSRRSRPRSASAPRSGSRTCCSTSRRSTTASPRLRFRGVRGTTGTEASFLELFDGDGAKVDELNRRVAERWASTALPVTGQTYTRKSDYAFLAALAGVATSASKFANDMRLLQHLKEIEEPFEEEQIGSSPWRTSATRCARNASTHSLDTSSR